MNPKSKEFKKLQETWYAKLRLKDPEFKDIEQNEHSLRLFHATYFSDSRRNDPNVVAAKMEYYRLAGHFLYDHKFDSTLEKTIWQMHSDGKSIRTIEKVLKAKGQAVYRDLINRILMRLDDEMVTKCRQSKT